MFYIFQAKIGVVGEETETDDSGLVRANVVQVHVFTHPNLVGADEIEFQQPTVVENSQPARSQNVTERLRLQDEIIVKALAEKHIIISQLLRDENVAAQI